MKNLKFYLNDALQNDYCIGAYNFFNIETLRGICEGCKKTNSPAIVAVSASALQYIGEKLVKPLFDSMKKEYNIPIFLHLDHGKDFEICKKAIDLGFDSVMFDGSLLDFDENIKQTTKIVKYAHSKKVLVEAELGILSKNAHNLHTDANQAKEFVEKTKCDTLAIAIGTSHGACKFEGNAKLDFVALENIEKLIPKTPLVLHGASSVLQRYVKQINKFGGEIENTKGIPEKMLSKCATLHHICKINVDTDLRLAFTATARKSLQKNPKNIDMREIGRLAISEIANLVAYKNDKIFGCKNKA